MNKRLNEAYRGAMPRQGAQEYIWTQNSLADIYNTGQPLWGVDYQQNGIYDFDKHIPNYYYDEFELEPDPYSRAPLVIKRKLSPLERAMV